VQLCLARWNIYGACIRSSGHGFIGINRKRLLEILQERARALGVALHFERFDAASELHLSGISETIRRSLSRREGAAIWPRRHQGKKRQG
jgi:hypothetical protein